MTLKIALAQFNATVGDIDGNTARIRELIADIAEKQVDVLVLPEMCICGYPPEDLLHKGYFLRDNQRAIDELAHESGEMVVIAGFAEPSDGSGFNSLAVMQNGALRHVYRKVQLPNYGVFDEARYFQRGSEPLWIEHKDVRILLTICEDIWQTGWLESYIQAHAPEMQLIVNASASPFNVGKLQKRLGILQQAARTFDCGVAYCNLLGGQDELVFDGRSMLIDASGTVIAEARAFEEDTLVFEVDVRDGRAELLVCDVAYEAPDHVFMSPEEEIYQALVLGTRDYVRKNGFSKALIGLSGGVDSSLTAALAVDALGKENVIGITMPSRFNTAETITDAERTAQNLEIEFHTLPIADILEQFNQALGIVEGWSDEGLAFENLQARIRGALLMSLSNQFGALVLTTGNKSETAVGYSTLYGDTAGGFAVIKDVPKTMVYRLCHFINVLHDREIVPLSVIERAPSAELRPDQKDTDSLPDYNLLDTILKGYVENDKSAQELIDEGLPQDIVRKVIRLVDRNEYKRRQCPPGVRITPKAFGKDRRMPITNRYSG